MCIGHQIAHINNPTVSIILCCLANIMLITLILIIFTVGIYLLTYADTSLSSFLIVIFWMKESVLWCIILGLNKLMSIKYLLGS